MQELIKVTVQNDRQLVSARELYKGLELKKRFSVWVNQNFSEFEEGQDYTRVPEGTVVQSGNGTVRRYDDYALTIDMAKQLCLMSRTEKGKQYRKYLIEVERKWNDPQEIVKRGYAILQNENTRLKLENKQMKPKALFADAVATSKNDILIGQLAKILRQNGYETGQNRLFNGYVNITIFALKGSNTINQLKKRWNSVYSESKKEQLTTQMAVHELLLLQKLQAKASNISLIGS